MQDFLMDTERNIRFYYSENEVRLCCLSLYKDNKNFCKRYFKRDIRFIMLPAKFTFFFSDTHHLELLDCQFVYCVVRNCKNIILSKEIFSVAFAFR